MQGQQATGSVEDEFEGGGRGEGGGGVGCVGRGWGVGVTCTQDGLQAAPHGFHAGWQPTLHLLQATAMFSSRQQGLCSAGLPLNSPMRQLLHKGCFPASQLCLLLLQLGYSRVGLLQGKRLGPKCLVPL